MRKHILGFQDCISAIERCPYPVIAATHGVAYGLSIDIISACDVRYAASNVVFAIKVCLAPCSTDVAPHMTPALTRS